MLRPYFDEIHDDARIHIPTYHQEIMLLIKDKVYTLKGSFDPFFNLPLARFRFMEPKPSFVWMFIPNEFPILIQSLFID